MSHINKSTHSIPYLVEELLLKNPHRFLESYSEKSVSGKPANLDDDFSRDISILAKSLSKLSGSERKVLVIFLAAIIERYLEEKINRELELAIKKILKPS